VLPVSPKPPRDFGLNLDAEFGEIAKMVRAGVTQAPRREGPNPVDRDPSMLARRTEVAAERSRA
jgi:hypothetical protein